MKKKPTAWMVIQPGKEPTFFTEEPKTVPGARAWAIMALYPADATNINREHQIEEAFQLCFQGYNSPGSEHQDTFSYMVFLRKKLTDAFSILQKVTGRNRTPQQKMNDLIHETIGFAPDETHQTVNHDDLQRLMKAYHASLENGEWM